MRLFLTLMVLGCFIGTFVGAEESKPKRGSNKLCFCGRLFSDGEKPQKVTITTEDKKRHTYSICSDPCADALKSLKPADAVQIMDSRMELPEGPKVEKAEPFPRPVRPEDSGGK